MGLPRRRTLWLSAALLLAVGVGAWYFVPRSRITQENLHRIQMGMTLGEVQAILGEGEPFWLFNDSKTGRGEVWDWDSAHGHVHAFFRENELVMKEVRLRTSSETLTWYVETVTWYAKKGAKKIGVKWQ